MTLSRSLPRNLALACIALALAGGCDRVRSAMETDPKSARTAEWTTEWSPERIAENPVGYLTYAESRIDEQIRGREERLAALGARRVEIERKALSVNTKLGDARNVNVRLNTAARRADDENGWPIKFAGRTFDRAKAEAVIKATATYVDDVSPLAQAYANAIGRLDATEIALNNDIVNLQRLREKIGLDLERVRLNEGVAELTELRKTEAELASFSRTLADMSSDLTVEDLRAVSNQPEPVDVESLLK
jgi:hypothetical protein